MWVSNPGPQLYIFLLKNIIVVPQYYHRVFHYLQQHIQLLFVPTQNPCGSSGSIYKVFILKLFPLFPNASGVSKCVSTLPILLKIFMDNISKNI